MKTKLRKIIYTAAAALFIGGLAINIYMTLDDPFENVSSLVMAEKTGTGTEQDGDEEAKWVRTTETCSYTVYGEAGSEVKIFGGTVLKIGAKGYIKYEFEKGEIICSTGGNSKCKDRNCPNILDGMSGGTGTGGVDS